MLLILASIFPIAGNSIADELAGDQLEYYLFQSFSAASAAKRIALNHIGIEVEETGARYIVSASLEGYPAHTAGIERGDIIHSVNNEDYHPVFSFNKASDENNNFIAVPSTYSIEFERNGNRQTAEITPVFENLYDSYRSAVGNSILKFSSGNKVIGYIRLWGFSRSTNDLIALSNFIREFDDCDGLILDLRNSYGYLSDAHLQLFLANPDTLSSEGYYNSTEVLSSKSHSNLKTIPLSQDIEYFTRPVAILLNGQTRGGGELLAYALDGLERFMSIGQTTPGRIGEYLSTASDSNALLYFPEDQAIVYGERAAVTFETKGVSPEHLTDYPINLSTRSDPQYESAVSFLLGAI